MLGHAYSLLLGRWIVSDLGLHWVISLFTFNMIYLLIGVLTCIMVPEKIIELKDEEEKGVGEKICAILGTCKNYYQRRVSNILLAI